MKVPKNIGSKLTLEPMTGYWVKQIAPLTMNYQAEDGTQHGFKGLYDTSEERFDAAANPSEPPMFGQEVSHKDGLMLSVARPQDLKFEPFTDDGKNIMRLDAENYKT